MEEEETDTDSTVLLKNYNDKPEKIDVKRRRLSSLHDGHADKYEDENTVPHNPSDNIRTVSPPEKQKNKTDNNLHVIQYLVGLGDINIKNNKAIDFQIAPAPLNLSNQISGERKSYEGDTLKRATICVNDEDIIFIESDDENETRIDETQNEDINNAAGHKLYGDNNNLPENKHGKLTVLKPAVINARRTTSNVFERSEFPSNGNDSFSLDENRQPKVRVLKPSVINARRATTSFERKCNAINERIIASKSTLKNKKLTVGESSVNYITKNEITKETAKDYYGNPKNYDLPKTSSNATKEERYNITGSSDKVQVINTNTTVSVASKTLLNPKMKTVLNANPHKRSSNDNETPTESKRFRIETTPKFTKEIQLKNLTFEKEVASHKLTAKLDKDQIRKSNERNENEKQNNTHSKSENTENYSKPGTSLKVPNPKTFKTADKQESSKLQDKQITSEGHYEQEASEAYGMQGTNNVQNEQEMCMVPNAEKVIRVHDEQVINRSQDKQEKTEVINAVQDQQVILEAHDKQEKCKVLKEQITNKPHNEQQRSKVQDDEISQVHDMRETSKVKGTRTISIPQNKHEISKIQDDEISQVRDMQETNNVQGQQIISNSYNEQKIITVQDDEIREVHDMQDTSKVQGTPTVNIPHNEHEISKIQDHDLSQIRDKQETNKVQENQRTTEVYKQATKKVNDVQKTSETINELEENKRNITRKVIPGGLKGLLLKFQVQFFRFIKEYIKKDHPESSMSLHNLTQSLIIDARNGIFHTNIKYSCPQCGHVSTLSANLLNDTDDENITTADDFQKCSLCQVLTKLHTTYMIRYLQEVAAKDEIKDAVEKTVETSEQEQETAANSQPLCNKKSVAVNLDSNIPVPTGNTNLAGESPAGKCLKENILDRSMDNVPNVTDTEIDAKRYNAQNDKTLTKSSVSPSKDIDSTSVSNLQIDITENNNKVPAVTSKITQENVKFTDTTEQVNGETLGNKIIKIVSRKSDDSYLKGAGMSESNNETELNHTANDESTNENAPEKVANNLQTITSNINVLDSSLKCKNNSMAVTAAGEEYTEKENKTVTENSNKIIKGRTSQKVSAKLDGKEIRNVSNEVEENDSGKKTNKHGDNISNNATSERSQTTAGSNPDIEITTKEKDSTDGNNLKVLMDCFTKIKNNIHTKGKEVKQAKAQQETNVALPVSASSNINKSFDRQPKIADVTYICPLCFCEYVHAAKLLSHMRNNHNSKLTTIPKNCVKRTCVFCNKPNIINYNTHVNKYHRDKFTVGKNESNDIHQGNSGTNNNERPLPNSDSSRYKYHCSICDEILTSRYACRQHRQQNHPDFKNQQIYNKVIIEGKEKLHHGDNEELNVANATSTIRNENEVRTRSEVNNDKHVRVGRSDTNSSGSISIRDISSDEEASTSAGNSDENLKDNEDSSDDDDNSLRTDTGHVTSDRENESDGNELEETYNNNIKCTKYVYVCKLCRATFSSYNVARKHGMDKHPHMSGTRLIKRIPNDDTSNGQNSERKEDKQPSRNDNLSSGDDGEIEDNIDKNSLRSDHEKEVNSNEEAIKASCHTLKKKKDRTTELFDNDNNAPARTKIKEKETNQDAKRKQSSDTLLTNKDDVLSERILDKDLKNCNENDPSVINEEKHASDNKNTKISKHAVMKLKERLTKLCNDKVKNAEADIIHKNYDQQHTEIEKTNAESASICSEEEVANVDERVNVSEHTVKRKKERITKFIGNNDNDDKIQVNETERDQEVRTSTTNASNFKPTDDESITKGVGISEKNVEKEYSNENCENEMHYQEITTEKCDKKLNGHGDEVTVSSELVANGNNKINILNNAETKVHNNDQTEIDMIDCLLEELNRKPHPSLRNETCGLNNSEIQDNDASHTTNLSVEVETSLENIKITNVISIADKLYIYICQECHFATDDYDSVIRHCQNHYNEIKDLVIYCQTCQLQYHDACFKRHEISHVRYLKSAKINFSYKLLFTNWQAVFENMLLRDAEDVQVKSIYTTFCVKMVVKENGPWQTSLHLCGKCNTCVPHQDIEKHVQQTCCFINYPCSVCDCKFLTNDMRKHHEIYHEVDKNKPFKIIVFNDKLDESFNLKLFQAKARPLNREKQGVSDIFKCLCGLCFVSLKNFKLHFVECEEQVNNGMDCPDCTVLRRFLPTELDDHLSLHHGTEKYDFRVQEIAFQDETNQSNSSEAVINSPDTETENGSLAEVEDVRDTLKGRHEISTQTTNDDSQNDPEANELYEEDLAVEDILKDETLTQNTNDNNSQRVPEASELNEDDIKREMLKDETLTQTTNDNDSQRDPESVELNEEDIAVKREMLKDESLTQNTNENDSQSDPKICDSNDNLPAIENLSSQEIMDVDEYEPLILIDDSDSEL